MGCGLGRTHSWWVCQAQFRERRDGEESLAQALGSPRRPGQGGRFAGGSPGSSVAWKCRWPARALRDGSAWIPDLVQWPTQRGISSNHYEAGSKLCLSLVPGRTPQFQPPTLHWKNKARGINLPREKPLCVVVVVTGKGEGDWEAGLESQVGATLWGALNADYGVPTLSWALRESPVTC